MTARRQRYSFALTGRAAAGRRAGRRRVAGARRRRWPRAGDRRRCPTDAIRTRRPSAALVCRPGPRDASAGIGPGTERDLGADQATRRSCSGEDRPAQGVPAAPARAQPGPRDDGVPQRGGRVPGRAAAGRLRRARVDARTGPTTVAMAQAFVADGADAFESLAEALIAWLLAPGEVSVEFATEIAADLGHADGRAARGASPTATACPTWRRGTATRDEVRAWAAAARRAPRRGPRGRVRRGAHAAPRPRAADRRGADRPRRAADRAGGHPRPRRLPPRPGPGRARRLSAIIDFEGEPLRTDRGAPRPSTRRCATSRRCCARSTTSRAAPGGGPRRPTAARSSARPGPPGWLRRARERFLEAYRDGPPRGAGLDRPWTRTLLRAFEVDKELYEFVYAATYLPSWLWAPTEGMRGLFDGRRRSSAGAVDRRRRRFDARHRGVVRRRSAASLDAWRLGARTSAVASPVRVRRPGQLALRRAGRRRRRCGRAGGTAWAEYAVGGDAPTRAGRGPRVRRDLGVGSDAGGRRRRASAHRGRSLVIAVTNDPDSPLAEVADSSLPLHAGEEASGIADADVPGDGRGPGVLPAVATRGDARGPTRRRRLAGRRRRPIWRRRDGRRARSARPSIDVLAPSRAPRPRRAGRADAARGAAAARPRAARPPTGSTPASTSRCPAIGSLLLPGSPRPTPRSSPRSSGAAAIGGRR